MNMKNMKKYRSNHFKKRLSLTLYKKNAQAMIENL